MQIRKRHILPRSPLRRTALAGLIAAGSIGGAVLANGTATASTVRSSTPAAAGPVVLGADSAIEHLVANHTLSSAQGAAIEQQIQSGSIDPKQLVEEGVVTDTQMRAAADAIDQVKRNNG